MIKILNEALATEIVCVLRYKYHYYMAKGIHAKSVAAEFLEHANEEQGHADRIAQRITQLDGTPNLNPEGRYRVRVVATDELSNPPDRVTRDEMESSVVLVDNTPPTVEGLKVVGKHVQGVAIDGVYLTADDMSPALRGKPVQAWLAGEAMMLATLD